MKVESKKELFVEMTPAQAAAVNGGRRGRGKNDGPNHDLGDDRGVHAPGHT